MISFDVGACWGRVPIVDDKFRIPNRSPRAPLTAITFYSSNEKLIVHMMSVDAGVCFVRGKGWFNIRFDLFWFASLYVEAPSHEPRHADKSTRCVIMSQVRHRFGNHLWRCTRLHDRRSSGLSPTVLGRSGPPMGDVTNRRSGPPI